MYTGDVTLCSFTWLKYNLVHNKCNLHILTGVTLS